ncbi:MAG TPA: cyclodeaminase/cyclohydrolase family protein [Tepidisphaeraceae bacterium]|nr:cyclodeaminase/cyclohydrolase family protein [Tepidisphaeraceae bacterium]
MQRTDHPMYDRNTSIAEFLRAASARQATPGGGSVSALAGALAAAMGEMVLNYSIGKKGLEIYQEDFHQAESELRCARDMLLMLMSEDQSAYAALTAARKLPQGSERDAKASAALLGSIHTPQSMAATAIAVLQICERVMDFVNWHLLSDLAVCAELAMATARCAIYNVRVNLPDLNNDAERKKVESDLDQMLSRGKELIQRIIPHIWARHRQGP